MTSYKVLHPELFRAGRIELHTKRKTMNKRIRASGTHVVKDHLHDCIGACYYDDLNTTGVLYVYVGDGEITTAVHECFHAAVRYLAWVGVPLEHNKSNEVYAYFQEYLVREYEGILK